MFLVVMFLYLIYRLLEGFRRKTYWNEKWYSNKIQYIGKNNVIFV